MVELKKKGALIMEQVVVKSLSFLCCSIAATLILHTGYEITDYFPRNGYEGALFIASYVFTPLFGGAAIYRITKSKWATFFLVISLLVLGIENALSILPFVGFSFIAAWMLGIDFGHWAKGAMNGRSESGFGEMEDDIPEFNPATGYQMLSGMIDTSGNPSGSHSGDI